MEVEHCFSHTSNNQSVLMSTQLPEDVVQVKGEFLLESRNEVSKQSEGSNAEDFEGAQSSTNSNDKQRDLRDSRDSNQKKEKHKKRPRDEREAIGDKLCQSFAQGGVCDYGDKCRFNHDISKYLATKAPDIGSRCHVYDTYGTCPTGLTCRFGAAHIVDNHNIERAEEDGGVIENVKINVLSKQLQSMLRKKKYQMPPLSTSRNEEKKESTTTTSTSTSTNTTTATTDFSFLPLDMSKRKLVDFSNKVYVAPLTTVGNLPFRRILKDYGADITVGEMALTKELLEGKTSEWALFRRHPCEDVFGVQVAGGFTHDMEKLASLIERDTKTDFVDLNCGCPIDLVCNKGAGCHLMCKPKRIYEIVEAMTRRLTTRSMTVKMRTGWSDNENLAHKIVPELQRIGHGKLAAIFIHGRSRQQRYARLANWEYVAEAAKSQDPTLPLIPIIGNGDILTWDDWNSHKHLMRTALEDDHAEQLGLCDCAMIGRGALMKPWLPKEIKDGQNYDIPASERMDILKRYVQYGLEHWGSDQQGVDNTRRFLLEWLSYLCRYVPVGITNSPQNMTQRPPVYFGRSDTETLLASNDVKDWIKISEMFLGPVKEGYAFEPKHKSSAYKSNEVQG
jgi:tRNA-dihydrouridine synthase 3